MAKPRELALLNKARRAIAEATEIDDIRDIIDKAEALRQYWKKAEDGLEIQNRAAEVKIRAERRAGEILREMEKAKAGRKKKNRSQVATDSSTLSYTELGINKSQASRWQQIASLGRKTFERHVTETKAKGHELTSAGTLKVARQIRRQAEVTVEVSDPKKRIVKHLRTLVANGETFRCIYADPPWPYQNQGTRAATDNHYPSMPLKKMAQLPIAQLAAKKAHLHLWTTNAFLFDAKGLMEAWGFEYKSVLVWVKPTMGIGNYWRVSHEFLLLGVRGGLQFVDRGQRSWIEAGRGPHSVKPEEVRQAIERVSRPPRLELFGRKGVVGWTVWGNQVVS